MKTACCWSGGKDSALAFWKAKNSNTDIVKIVNFVAQDSDRCCFHGIPSKLVQIQARLMDVELVQVKMPDSMDGYEQEFRLMLRRLKDESIDSMVFGDIYLDEHKEWIERVCKLENIKPILPLWGLCPNVLIVELEAEGFEAVVISCLERLGVDFIQTKIGPDLFGWFASQEICPCGEKGEYHTIVTDAPMFSGKIELFESKAVLVEGFWKHWHLDISRWTIKEKTASSFTGGKVADCNQAIGM